MFENQPKGLYALALANTGERFGYYTMLAVFALFLRANYGLDAGWAGEIYSDFLMLVYFLPIVGGWLADKFGFGRMVTIGILIMFAGYLLLSVPLGGDTLALVVMLAALVLIGLGTGLFKGNLQVMVGDLYNDPRYAGQRDSGFSIFYMAINIGALFAPTAAVKIMEWAQQNLGTSVNDSYHFAFAVACASLILSIAIYYVFRSTFRHVEGGAGKKGEQAQVDHQNGLSLTFFADEFTSQTSTGVEGMAFDVWNLVALIFIVYAGFSFFQSKTSKARIISAGVIALAACFLFFQYDRNAGEIVAVSAPIFQQFNPFYVVALTPVSLAIFGALAKSGKEPSAPRKIAYGMVVAGLAYCLMACASFGLPMPQAAIGPDGESVSVHVADVTPQLLIYTYLILTFAELLLSPMGISFVSKVAPPKYKGLMMGGWFVATAIGNKLVGVGGYLWGSIPLWAVWSVFIALCAISAIFMFSIMKRLEKVC